MKSILSTLMIAAVIGCGNYAGQEGITMDSFPVINPDDPDSIARWESSQYNFESSKISVVKLKFFHGFLGGSAPKEPKSVALEVCEAKTNGITPEQQSAIDKFIQDEPAIHSTVRDAIYENYKETHAVYREAWSMGAAMFGGNEDEINDILPEIVSGDELDDLVQIGTIFIHPPNRGSVSIGIDFYVPWDEENAMGLRLRDGQIETIGTAHESAPGPKSVADLVVSDASDPVEVWKAAMEHAKEWITINDPAHGLRNFQESISQTDSADAAWRGIVSYEFGSAPLQIIKYEWEMYWYSDKWHGGKCVIKQEVGGTTFPDLEADDPQGFHDIFGFPR